MATINKIIKALGVNLKYKLAMPYNQFIERPRLADPGLIINWRCSNVEFSRLANVSRVVLSLQRRFSSTAGAVAAGSTPPPRLFEVGLAGGFQVFVSDSHEAERYYVNGEEFCFCETDESAISAIRDALADPEKRIAMARAARERTLREHTYRNRAARIVAAIDGAEPRPTRHQSEAKTLLIVTHNILSGRAGGGVEIYQDQLRRSLIEQSGLDHGIRRVLFLHPTRKPDGRPVLQLVDKDKTTDFPLDTPISDYDLHHAQSEVIFQNILVNHSVDLVHFQHLLGYPLSLPLISRAYGVPSVYTYHDHFLLCKRFTLLNYESRYCAPRHDTLSQCDVCLHATENTRAGSQARRRAFMSTVLNALDAVVTNTPASAGLIKEVYDIDDEKIRVVEMMMPTAIAPKLPRRTPVFDHRRRSPLRVAIPGNFTDVKGGHYIIRLIHLLRGENIEFTIIGRVDPALDGIMGGIDLDNLHRTGAYDQSAILELLQEFDVALHLAIWPETYVIALSEAWSSGLVPIVTRLGAQNERVTEDVDGLKVAPNNVGEAADVLRRIRYGDIDLAPMRAAIAKKKINGPAEHIEELTRLYKELFARKPVAPLAAAAKSSARFDMTAFDCGAKTNSQRWNSDGIDWDESIEAPELVEPVVLHRFPQEYGYLSMRTASVGPDVTVHYEKCTIDGTPIVPRMPMYFTAVRSADLEGWVRVPTTASFVEMYAALESKTGEILVSAPCVERLDVVHHFGDGSFARGFGTQLPVSLLEDGFHALRFYLVFDRFVIRVEGAGGASLKREPFASAWSQDLAAFGGDRSIVRLDGDTAVLTNKNSQEATGGSIIELSGWTNPIPGHDVAGRVAVVILDAEGAPLLWTEVERCMRPQAGGDVDQMFAFSGIKGHIEVPPLSPGRYGLALAQELETVVGLSGSLDVLTLGEA